MEGVVRKDWREAVVDDTGKVERIPYELCVLVALRDAIRRREIYIEGGLRWRNPENAMNCIGCNSSYLLAAHVSADQCPWCVNGLGSLA